MLPSPVPACLGLDAGVLKAWSGALGSMKRHFAIRDSYSPGIGSSRGVPEGCGMSIVAMMGVASLFHHWVQASVTSPTVLSFVDNWEVLVGSPEAACKALDSVLDFAKQLDLSVDLSKTFFWSTSAQSRKALRARGHAVRLSTKDAHMIYGRQISNGAQLQRIEDLAGFWDRLAKAKGHHKDKVRVVVTAAWPRAFHACSAVMIGRKHYVKLRTLVLRALDLEKPHANAWLQCALDHPLLDPMFYVALSSLRDLRSLAEPAETRVALTCEQSEDFAGGLSSITSVAVSRMQSLGFQVLSDGWVQDGIGQFDVLGCPYVELVFRAQLSWTTIVAQAVSHRSDFGGFSEVDLGTTRWLTSTFALPDQGLLWRTLNGSVLCNDKAYHWSDSGSTLCMFCGQEDSLPHRLWYCSATRSLRGQLPAAFRDAYPLLPPAVSSHGWVPKSPYLEAWFRELCAVPPAATGFCPLPAGGILDLFTDGSCFWPFEPLFRVASWSVVVMAPCSPNPTKSDAQVLLAQPLSGVRQTPGRAELMAVLQAVRVVVRLDAWARIWTDSESVWKRYHSYVVARDPIRATAADSDLWIELLELVEQIGSDRLRVIKVPGHEQPDEDESDLDIWVRLGNHCADRAAVQANQHRTEAFWKVWDDHMTAVIQNRHNGWLMLRHICDCMTIWVQAHQEQVETPVAPKPKRKGVRVIPSKRWSNPHDFVLQKPTFCRSFNQGLADRLSLWLRSLWDVQAPLVWVSFWQLYVLFCWDGDLIHAVKVSGKWQLINGESAQLANHWAIQTRVKYFRLMLQQFFKDCSIDLFSATTKPVGLWIQCFKGCVAFQLSADAIRRVDEWLGRHLASPANNQGLALHKLPDPW